MTTFFPTSPLKMGSLFILALLAVIGYMTIRIVFPDRHGIRDTAHPGVAVEKCLNDNGVFQTMKEPNGRTHLICLDKATGLFYDVVYKVRTTVEGVTTFRITEVILKNGTTIKFDTVEQYVAYLVQRGNQLKPTTEFGPFELIFP